MRPSIREVLVVAVWIIPVAVAANVLGFLFLLAFENRRNDLYGYVGYLVIPAVIGFVVFSVALWNRPPAKSWRHALFVRPVALYLFLAMIGAWLAIGFRSPGFGLIAPIAVAPIVASLAGISAVIICARPSTTS